MTLRKRIRDIALGLGALAGVGIAAEKTSQHTEAPVAAASATMEHNDTPGAREAAFWGSEDGKQLANKMNLEAFAESKAGKQFTKKSLDGLANALRPTTSKDAGVQQAKASSRKKMLAEAATHFDLYTLQHQEGSFIELLLAEATDTEIKANLENPEFSKALHRHRLDEREYLAGIRQSPPLDDSGRVTRDKDELQKHQALIAETQRTLKRLDTLLGK